MATARERLEQARRRYARGEPVAFEPRLRSLRHARLEDPAALIRVHDTLLFLRAFPPNSRVLSLSDELLATFYERVRRMRQSGADMAIFDPEDVSGIAGTAVSDTFTYEVARWLWKKYGNRVMAEWDEEEQSARMAATLPRFLPLLEDDSLVEADVPYLEWLHAADRGKDLSWLMERFERLQLPIAHKTEIYDALGLTVIWDLSDSPASRTNFRWPVGNHFFHRDGFIQRRQISLAQELASADIPVRQLSRIEGEKVLDMERTAVTIRYRELWGTTRGDPAQVVEARPGRGVSIFLWGLPPDRRLPLRAYHAGLTVKNGVPIGYIEDIGLFEWVEIGFNTFYAYRDGESAWIYSKILHLFRQLFGYTCFSVYPYQLGADNEEAIKSGAFWFYRKLGFRPGPPDLLALAEREERKIAADPAYRTSARTLRKLAAGHVFYEMPGTVRGLWDRFSTRRLGIAVQQYMAKNFGGDPEAMRREMRRELSRALGVNLAGWSDLECETFDDWAAALAPVPGIARWNNDEKRLLARTIRAKAAHDEAAYLRGLQRHQRLKQAILKLGSGP